MENKKLNIIPIGGLEEVGKNMMVLEYRGEMIIVDCGLKFPDADTPGVDFIINDFSYVINNQDKLIGIAITHGHLDHIGALSKLLVQVNRPIYCSEFTRTLIEKILSSSQKKIEPVYKIFKPNKKFNIGCFEIEAIKVNHSIIDAASFAITTPVGTIIHTGDWRIDPTPTNEAKIDLDTFRAYGKKGVLALFSDSTNAVKKGSTSSESIISENLENVFLTAKERIIIATFSTQVNRIRNILNLAKIFKRKVVVIGRSMIDMIGVSLNLDALEETDLFINLRDLKNADPKKVLILTTGTQGEQSSGLQRMAEGVHKQVTLTKEDTIVLSSSFIPGNEHSINKLLNLMYKKEFTVITSKDFEVHVSGHAAAEELKQLIRIVQPQFFFPIHGQSIHLVNHKKLAMEEGVPEHCIFLLENGSRVELTNNSAKICEKIKLKDYYIEGRNVKHIPQELFEERLSLCDNGVVSAFITVRDLKIDNIEIASKGFINRNENTNTIEEIKSVISTQLNKQLSRITSEKKEVENVIKKEMRKYIGETLGKYPLLFTSLYLS